MDPATHKPSAPWVSAKTALRQCFGVVFAISILVQISAVAAQEAIDPASLAPAQDIIRDMRAITSDSGIDELMSVEIGGIEQWISVRGRDRDNPILLFIHGGPAVPAMPTSWIYQSPWEDFFTVVQWDQRGAGKTMRSSKPELLSENVSIAQYVSDAEELVAYLRETYGKSKIFVMGHSWGTVIGLQLAERRPEWLHAYIGMGQALDFIENERLGTEFVLQEAERQGHQQALQEMQAIAPYPDPSQPLSIENLAVQRKWLTYFGGLARNRNDLAFEENAALLSPDYTPEDHQAGQFAGISAIALLTELADKSLMNITQLETPLFIFAGRHDHATSSVLAAEWFAEVIAPEKHFIWFEDVAHEIQYEAPGKLLMHLVTNVRPLATQAGDGPAVE